MTTPKEAAAVALEEAYSRYLYETGGVPSQSQICLALEQCRALRATPPVGELTKLERAVVDAAVKARAFHNCARAKYEEKPSIVMATSRLLDLFDAVDALRRARQPEPLEEALRIIGGPASGKHGLGLSIDQRDRLASLIDAALAQKGGSRG